MLGEGVRLGGAIRRQTRPKIGSVCACDLRGVLRRPSRTMPPNTAMRDGGVGGGAMLGATLDPLGRAMLLRVDSGIE